MASASIMQHLHRLAVDIGERPIGSAANHHATQYVEQILRNVGLEVEEQRFDCPHWEAVATELHLGDQPVNAVANMFSPSCDVTAPTVMVGTLAELEQADLAGRIGVLYGDLVRDALAAKNYPVYVSDRDRQIIEMLEAKMPAALLTVQHEIGSLVRLIEDWDLSIASATVSPETGLKLVRQNGQMARLRIDSRRSDSYGSNIVATRQCTRPERIVLCAHFDTKIYTPGAYDNAGSTAVLLALAEHFAQYPCVATLEFVAFNGEEYYAIGDQTYIAHSADRFGSILAAINLDGVGPALGTNTIVTFSSSQSFTNAVMALMEEYPGVVWTGPWPASNHYTFYSRNVPSVALSSRGQSHLLHQPHDTIDWISEEKLEEVLELVVRLVDLLQDKPLAWSRP